MSDDVLEGLQLTLAYIHDGNSGLNVDDEESFSHWITRGVARIESLQAEVERLRNPWVRVQTLTPDGCVEVPGPQYPEPGQTVLIEIHSAQGIKHEVGGLHKYAGTRQGYWSWPSFGTRWMPIPQQGQEEA